MVLRQRPGCVFLALSTVETWEIAAKSQVGCTALMYTEPRRDGKGTGERERNTVLCMETRLSPKTHRYTQTIHFWKRHTSKDTNARGQVHLVKGSEGGKWRWVSGVRKTRRVAWHGWWRCAVNWSKWEIYLFSGRPGKKEKKKQWTPNVIRCLLTNKSKNQNYVFCVKRGGCCQPAMVYLPGRDILKILKGVVLIQ